MKFQDRKFSLKQVSVIVLIAILLSAMIIYITFSSKVQASKGMLHVEIQPRNVKLIVNQTQSFQAIVFNGTEPFTYEWCSNNTIISNAPVLNFSFKEPAFFTIISVTVKDAFENFGHDITYVYDPDFVPPEIYLEAFPSTVTYTINTDGDYTWATRYDGKIAFNGTDASTVIQSVSDLFGDEIYGAIAFEGGKTFELSSPVTFNATYLKILGNYATLKGKFNDYTLKFGTSSTVRNLEIENLIIRKGVGGSKTKGIYLHQVLYPIISGCDVQVYERPLYVCNFVSGIVINSYLLGDTQGVYIYGLASKEFSFISSDLRGYGSGNSCIKIAGTYYSVSLFDTHIESSTKKRADGIVSSTYHIGMYGGGISCIDTAVKVTSGSVILIGVDLTGNIITKVSLGSGVKAFIEGNPGYVTKNSGAATVANNEWVAHGLSTTPTNVIPITKTATYGTPAVAVVVGWVDQNSTHFQVSAYWTNSTAIADDAVNITWYAEV